jgi:hypothetical protein
VLIAALGGHMAIWHRPKYGPGHTLLRNGSQGAVVSAAMFDRCSVLRSRRD